MCTVTYFSSAPGKFILTSNRDESPSRATAEPASRRQVGGLNVVYPLDPQGKGTWIASSQKFTLCLLNGAGTYKREIGPFRKSRGLVLLEFYDYHDVDKYVAQYNFKEIESFTMIILDHCENLLWQLRWNGVEMEKLKLNSSIPHIWSSHTLYSNDVVNRRQGWFLEFLSSRNVRAKTLMDFHRFGGHGNPEEDLVMARKGKVMTVSITQIIYEESHKVKYQDLRQKNKDVELQVK